MKIIYDAPYNNADEVYVGQARRDEHGVYVIVTKGESKEKPFNVVMFTDNEDEQDIFGAINWSGGGVSAGAIIAEFPEVLSATLIFEGAE